MAKRGRKPINIGALSGWEHEWSKAFHLLRDGWGYSLEQSIEPELARLTLKEIEARMAKLKARTPEQLIAEKEQGRRLPPKKRSEWTEWQALVMEQKIAPLQWLKVKKMFECPERSDIWEALWRARTLPSLRSACERWDKLPEIRGRNPQTGRPYDSGLGCFPAHILGNGRRFLSLTGHSRFPRSRYADDSRLDFLARGMAGVIMRISPLTAIERLRNLKHGPGGRLWNQRTKRCDCWRCENKLLGQGILPDAFEKQPAKEQRP